MNASTLPAGAALRRAEAERFVRRIAGDAPVVFQTFDDSPAQRRIFARVIGPRSHLDDALWDELDEQHSRGAAVFLTINELNGSQRRAEHVKRVRALFLDLDGAPVELALAAAPEPHLVVESSPGKYHVYWLVQDCPPSQFKAAQQALARRFGGDPKVCDLPRVMRVPGFLHRKTDQHHMVRIQHEAPPDLPPYTMAALRDLLGSATITTGGRNDALSRLAYRLHKDGLSAAALEAALLEENRRLCDPPLPDDEVRAIARGKAHIPTDDDRRREVPEALAPTLLVDVDDALTRLVHIEQGNCVGLLPDADEAPRVLTLAEARGAFAGSIRELNAWMAHAARLSVQTTTWAPGAPRFTPDPQGRRAFNVWSAPPYVPPPPDWPAVAALFLEHVEYLVPDPAERGRFIDWLAHIEQRPGELPHYGFLFVTPAHGIGRNWLAQLFLRLWPGQVAPSVALGKLLARDFGGQIARKLLAVVDEVYLAADPRTQRSQENDLRQLMTADQRYNNQKGGPETVEHNSLRWFLCSNNENALPLSAQDRRLFVVRNPDTPLAPERYSALYAALARPEFVASVRALLAARDLRHFNPGERPPLNAAKRSLIEAARPALDRELIATLRDWPHPVATGRELMEDCELDPDDKRSAKQFSDAMRRLGHCTHPGDDSRGRISHHGRRIRVWVIREHARWTAAPVDELLPMLPPF